ncbi:MAG: ABC transporter ATP-binding protein [Flavobacteriales bacterium CG_4_9_14_3_um_filter_40_17]|nr:MAG: ABC transporter ATP-binding protein [Flavobacteriales bacterium CG_4_9_14_3_um_filter_40_17]
MSYRYLTCFYQLDEMDCGPSCLRMVANYYGKRIQLNTLRNYSYIVKDGVSLLGISQAAEKIGFKTFPAILILDELLKDTKNLLPCILHWNQNHFVVLHKIRKKKFTDKYVFQIADPAHGILTLNEDSFKKSWQNEDGKGIALFVEPTQKFYENTESANDTVDFSFLFRFLKPYKKEVFLLFLGLLTGSLLSLIFPFLTQALIDKGVASKSLNIVFVILLSQVFLFLGSTVIQIVRSWVMLYIGTRINITIISDFLKKIFNLPIKFFETKLIGDFQQRIQDHERIEHFLTSQSLTTLFSIINFSVFFFVLLYYDEKIVITYVILTTLAIFWSVFFLKNRKHLDYSKFQQQSQNQGSIYELINGVQEIKLNGFEAYKRKEWEKIQLKLFNVNLKILKLDQFQLIGFEFINQLKNIFVTFIAAREVILNNITLGAMLAISYIIGQLNSPVNQLVDFFRTLQDARLSLARLNEVQNIEDEEKPNQIIILKNEDLLSKENGIRIKNLYYQYEGPLSPFVLKNINFLIKKGETTAIVGASGSGKTTLLKILLKFYDPIRGDVFIEGHNILKVSAKSWRENCGVVMQNGYIFSDSIERNIAAGEEKINFKKLKQSIRIANLEEFIDSLPLKSKTKIGDSGMGLSGGQKQRILIARAVYKNPRYILFDEATSALDAENEKVIYENLQEFFRNKTVLIIAHRLSTVKNANQIIVLNKGEIVEQGNHTDLVKNKSVYYNLVKNQLELGV